MNRVLYLAFLLSISPAVALAGHWEFDASGLAGAYYGISETKDIGSVDNLANRWVTRADASFKSDYVFQKEHRLGLRADTTLIFKAHDRSRRNGEWRFFPYLTDDSSWGNFKLGYVYNAAYQLHRGARDITFLGVEATNLVYFLSNPNWANKTKSVKFATPKSVAMINDGRAPKLSYITPWLGNTKFGFSYTPDNAHRRGMVSRYTDYEKTMDGYVWAMQNKWQLSSSVLYTSAGYGIFNRTDKEASVGVRWQKGSFNLGAGYKKAYVDGKENAIATARVNAFLPAYFDNYRESEVWNFSLGYDFGRYKTNVAYFQSEAANTRHRDVFYLWSNAYRLSKNLDVVMIGSYLNAHGDKAHSDDNAKGYALIGGLAFRF